ncbi:signal transduction histidine kinase [Marmoricola sp. OAE513]|uniref:ATP-binding protein n=1 Tax=Marmoricola sp. OAE513 TaxID=2817894 RepID=UPI001AE690B7
MTGTATPPAPVRKAYRNADEGVVGGVAAGLAEHLGMAVSTVRIGFIAATVIGGFGVMFYAALWMVLPVQRHFDDAAPGLAAVDRQGKRPRRMLKLADYGPLIALGALGLGICLLLAMVSGRGQFLVPVLLAVGGVAVLWRQADEAQRERWVDSTGRISLIRVVVGDGGPAPYLRLVIGVLMVGSAIIGVSVGGGGWGAVRDVGVATALGLLGIALITGPWLIRLTSDLGEERAERIRSQERADVAAHLHDSVLQTLTLIQKSAGDPSAVARLARAQERDLRSWLFDSAGGDTTTLAVALRALGGEVEDAYGVPVEVVCVGDRTVTEDLRALVLATREAVVNAARHSGAAKVDVYAEATARTIEIFVRDRGTGFDLDSVASDRHGVRDSIIERMRRHGGTAEIRSTPGSGTEVRLTQPTGSDSHG